MFGFHVVSDQSGVPVGFKLDLELRTDLLNKKRRRMRMLNILLHFFNNMHEASLSRWT